MQLVRLVTLAGLAALGALAASAEEEPSRACVPGRPIDRIVIERVNVFDTSIPEEDKPLYRFVNLVHSPNLSREWTIRAALTLDEGDPCSREALREAARALRAEGFLQDAWVTAEEGPDGELVVRVRVQDAWSTRVSVSVGREGGVTETSFGIREKNLLGTGSTLSYSREKDQDRTERTFGFSIPSIGRSRWGVALASQDNSDGEGRSFAVRRPFWRLDARWSFRASYDEGLREEKVYACTSLEESASLSPCVEPDDVDRYDRDEERSAVQVGWSPHGLRGGRLWRYGMELVKVEERWLNARSRAFERPDLTPRDRDLVLLSVGATWRRIDFRELSYLNSARRVEDFDLGDAFSLWVGRSLGELSEQSGAGVAMEFGHGSKVGSSSYVTLSGGFSQRYLEGDWYQKVLSFEGRFLYKPSPLQSILVDLDIAWGDELEGPSRFLLGGSFGMRAYASRSFVGDRALVLNLEHRFFTPWYIGRLARVGLVGFAEAGAVWAADESISSDKVHPGLGIGLRAQILRSSGATTLHLNAAFPLDPNAGPENEDVRVSFVTATGW